MAFSTKQQKLDYAAVGQEIEPLKFLRDLFAASKRDGLNFNVRATSSNDQDNAWQPAFSTKQLTLHNDYAMLIDAAELGGYDNVYYTVNATRGYRKTEQMAHINAFYVDIDVPKDMRRPGLANVVYNQALDILHKASIAPPHAAVFSCGELGGIHLYWFTSADVDVSTYYDDPDHHRTSQINRAGHRETLKTLVATLNDYAEKDEDIVWRADANCTDLTRILRVPGVQRGDQKIFVRACGASNTRYQFAPFVKRTSKKSRSYDKYKEDTKRLHEWQARYRRMTDAEKLKFKIDRKIKAAQRKANSKRISKAKSQPAEMPQTALPVSPSQFLGATTTIKREERANLRGYYTRVCSRIETALRTKPGTTKNWMVLFHLYASQHIKLTGCADATLAATLTLASQVGFDTKRCARALSTTLKKPYNYSIEGVNLRLMAANVEPLEPSRKPRAFMSRAKHATTESRRQAWRDNALKTADCRSRKTRKELRSALLRNPTASLSDLAVKVGKTERHMRNLRSCVWSIRSEIASDQLRKLECAPVYSWGGPVSYPEINDPRLPSSERFVQVTLFDPGNDSPPDH